MPVRATGSPSGVNAADALGPSQATAPRQWPVQLRRGRPLEGSLWARSLTHNANRSNRPRHDGEVSAAARTAAVCAGQGSASGSRNRLAPKRGAGYGFVPVGSRQFGEKYGLVSVSAPDPYSASGPAREIRQPLRPRLRGRVRICTGRRVGSRNSVRFHAGTPTRRPSVGASEGRGTHRRLCKPDAGLRSGPGRRLLCRPRRR
jgi:hypothetical protein